MTVLNITANLKPFSKRNSPRVDSLRHDVPEHVRSRVLYALKQQEDYPFSNFSFGRVLDEVDKMILREYGHYDGEGVSPFGGNAHPAVRHAFGCSDERFLDFIEFCFRAWPYALARLGVDPVNHIFREENIGFELTAYRETVTDELGSAFPAAGRKVLYDFPQFVRKDNEILHQEVVRPCLDALARPGLQIAISEMMNAHQAYRRGEYADAITGAGAAFESVMRTICHHKGWPFDQNKDTCAKLVAICKENQLFPPFYVPVLEATGSIRNKISDAHGRGPIPLYPVSKEHADHMIRLASTNITFLVGLSGL
jgi:hypothetical protein